MTKAKVALLGKTVWRILAVALVATQLVACGSVLDALPGGGSGGSNDGDVGGGAINRRGDTNVAPRPPTGGGSQPPTGAQPQPPSETQPQPPSEVEAQPPAGTLSGVAKDGLIRSASVSVYAWNGAKGELLGSGMTDASGKYSLKLQVVSQPVLLEVSGGSYVEEATLRNISLNSGEFVYALQNYTAGQPLITSITYYTTLATGLAENFVRLGMQPRDAVEAANSQVGSIIGIDTRQVRPSDILEPDSLSLPEFEYSFATAALSSLTERISILNDSEPHRVFTSIRFIQAAYDDVRADGVLNGRGVSGDVVLGRIRLTSQIYRHELALHILRIANNKTANGTGRGPMQMFDLARRLNDSTDSIFGGDPVIPIDSEKPNVSAIVAQEFPNLQNGAVVFGGLSLSAMVTTFPGAVSAQLVLDDQIVGTAVDPENPAVRLDTVNLPIADGRHTLKFRVTDISGAIGESPPLDVNVSNQQTTIANISIREGSFLRGTQTVSAVISDPVGISKIEYLVERQTPNGVLPIVVGTQTDPRLNFDFDTTVIEDAGRYSFVIAVTNNAGVTTRSAAIGITIDNVPPVIRFGSTFRSGDGLDPGPLNEDSYNGRFRVNVTAFDPFGATLAVFVEGVRLPEDPDGAIFDVDTTQFTDGVKTLVAIATDRAGNQSTATSRQITFDNTGPRVSITSSTAAVALRGSFTVSYSVEESNFDEGFFIIWGDGAGPCRQGPVTLGSSTLTVIPSECQNRPGIIRIAVTAFDQLGNRSSAEVVVTVQ